MRIPFIQPKNTNPEQVGVLSYSNVWVVPACV